jgi:hypothetical protein
LKKGGAFAEQPPFKKEPAKPVKGEFMVIFFPLNFKELITLGREYPWPRPQRCLRCHGCRIWGHGFVLACFDGFNEPIEIKRYRCPDCDCIFRLRPTGYFERFQVDIATIRSSIFTKVYSGKWKPRISTSRQCHWFRALLRKIKAYLTDTWDQGIMAAFDELIKMGLVPVSRSI